MIGSKWMEGGLHRTEDRLERDESILRFIRLGREDRDAVREFIREREGGYDAVY